MIRKLIDLTTFHTLAIPTLVLIGMVNLCPVLNAAPMAPDGIQWRIDEVEGLDVSGPNGDWSCSEEEEDRNIEHGKEITYTWKEYTITSTQRLCRMHPDATLTISKSGEVVHEIRNRYGSAYFRIRQYSFTDITGNGVINLTISENNNGTARTEAFHFFEIGEKFRHIQSIDWIVLHGEIYIPEKSNPANAAPSAVIVPPSDLDTFIGVSAKQWAQYIKPGKPVLRAGYPFWFWSCHALEEYGTVLLKYSKDGFHEVAYELMAKPDPSFQNMWELAYKIKNGYHDRDWGGKEEVDSNHEVKQIYFLEIGVNEPCYCSNTDATLSLSHRDTHRIGSCRTSRESE